MSGKGSRPRPLTVNQNTFDNNYETIFGKKEKKEQYVPPPLPEVTEKKSKIEWQSGDTNK